MTAPRQAYEQGYYGKARLGYEDYLRRFPKGKHRLEAWQRLLEIALDVEGDLDRSSAHLEAMKLEFSDETAGGWDFLTRLAGLYTQRGHWNKALETWSKSMVYAGQDPVRLAEATMSMARIHRAQRGYGAALELLARSEVLASDGESRARCQYEVAQTYSALQRFRQAQEVLERIVGNRQVSKAVHIQAKFLLAGVYEREMDLDRARELFRSIRDDSPNPRVIDFRLANLGKFRFQVPGLQPAQ